jgi:hypothetical protein
MEPIVGLEDWFEGSGSDITACRNLDELFSEPAGDEETPIEAAEVNDPDAPGGRLAEPAARLTPDELISARSEAGGVFEDEEKVAWFDRWADGISEAAVAALDDLQKLSDALSSAQTEAADSAELVSEMRNTVSWQSKMTGPTPPLARPEAGTKVSCLLCEAEGECDGKWDERTGVHVCASCVENSKIRTLLITADGMASMGLGVNGMETTMYNLPTNSVSWTAPTYTVTVHNARDIIVNASWTGSVPEVPPAEEKQEVAPEAMEESPVPDGVVTEEAPSPEPEETPDGSEPSGFRVSLPEKFREALAAETEDGAGYQVVNIMMASGKLYENITALNCEEVIVPENISPEEIELIERVHADAAGA